MIKMKNLNKIYNYGKTSEVYALKQVNLEIHKGEMVAITGPSGSGKSTLLHIISGIANQTSGEYLFCNRDVSKMSDKEKCQIRNREIGIILQDFGLLGYDTVMRNVCMPQIIGGTYNKNIREKALHNLDIVGMKKLEKKKVNELSGGQKQRVAIARALTVDAKIIVADEPTGALDSDNTNLLMDLFEKLNLSGITIVVVTHNPLVADRCQVRYTISDGRLQLGAEK